MFSKVFALLALVAPLVSSLTLNTPDNVESPGNFTVTWTNAAGDPDTWSLLLMNDNFISLALANNVDPGPGFKTLVLPIVNPGDGFSLEAVNIANISDVFARTGNFSISAASSSPTSGGATSVSSSASASGTASSRSLTTTGTTTATSARSTSTAPATSTNGNAPNPAATNLSGASSLKFNAGIAIAAVVGVAGAAVVAL